MSFPKLLLVKEGIAGDDHFFLAGKNPQELGDIQNTERVAMYKLVQVGRLSFLPHWNWFKKVKP